MAALVVRVAANLDELRTNMQEGVDQIETTRAALQRMSSSYDGSKIIAQANATAAAIQQIGGVEQLTAAEAAKANVVLDAAIQKYEILGKTAPAGMQALATATKQQAEAQGAVNAQTEPYIGYVERLTERFLVWETLRGLVRFGEDALTSTAQLQDLSRATGVTTDELQRLAYVGQDLGLSQDQLAHAVENLSTRLAKGDGALVEAAAGVGLSWKTLRTESPLEVFLNLTDAGGKLADSQSKNEFAAALFGDRLGRQLVPALGDLRKAMADVPQTAIISDENIAKAHEFNDAVSHAWTIVRAWTVDLTVGLHDAMLQTGVDEMGMAQNTRDAASAAELAVIANTRMVASHGALSTSTAAVITEAQRMQNVLNSWRAESLEPLTAAQQEAIDVGTKLGKSLAEISQATGASQAAIHQYEEAQRLGTEATKKWHDAFVELQSSGVGWRGTLETINPVVAESVKQYLAAGVSQSALAVAYGLTATQVKAVKSELDDEVAAHKKEAAAIEEVTKLWDDYHELRVSHGGTATQIALAQIKQWGDDLTAKMKKAGTDTAEFYAALAAVSREKTASVLVDWKAIGDASKQSLEDAKVKADDTYYYVLAHSDQFTNAQIEHFRALALAAEDTAQQWGASFDTALDGIDAKAKATAADVVTTWASAMSQVAEGKGTLSGQIANAPLTDASRASTQAAYDAGRYFGPVVNGNAMNPHGSGVDWAALGYKADGGPVDAGRPYVVGERGPELFVPGSGGSIVPTGGGGVTIHAPITIQGNVLGSQEALSRLVGEAFIAAMKNKGVRLPGGA